MTHLYIFISPSTSLALLVLPSPVHSVFSDASPIFISPPTSLALLVLPSQFCPVFGDVCPFSGHRDKSTSPAHTVTTVSRVGSSGDKEAVLKQIDERSSVYTRLGQRELDPARNRHFGDAAQIFRCKIFAQGPEDLFPFILSVARRKQRAGGLFIQGCSAEREATGITARQGEGDETGSANSPRSSPPPSAWQCEPAGDDLDHSISLSACCLAQCTLGQKEPVQHTMLMTTLCLPGSGDK